MPSESMDGQDAIVFCIGNRAKRIFGYTSFIEWHRTSFYIKSQYEPMRTMKVSIHGPDPRPRHVGKQHFRLDTERGDVARRALSAGGGWSAGPGHKLPLDFTGRPIDDDTVLLVRFSAEWSMFVRGIPSAPTPQVQPGVMLHAVAPAPPPSKVTHVDLYMSTATPHWPDEQTIGERNAGMGPISNDAGMFLTAVISQWSVTNEPDPFGDLTGDTPLDDCVRGVAAAVDTTGVRWLCEKMMPRAGLETLLPRRRAKRRT